MTGSASQQPERNSIRFILDGEQVELTGVDPTRTVLQYLREDLGRTGTKEGCAEGDCGACTVVVAEVDSASGRLRARAINSCIQFLPTLDGKELITVESLQTADGDLHPVQQAMLQCHGSQCGFCTPGFVMSMFALFKNKSQPSRREIDDALAGNLCRCTGYRPIVDAALEMYDIESTGSGQAGWISDQAGCASSQDEARRVAALRKLATQETLAIESAARRYYSPRTASKLAELLSSFPDATLLAGGTDVGLWVTKQQRVLDTVIYTGNVIELCSIETGDRYLEIGAAVSLSDAMPAIVAEYPEMEELLVRFASPPIRNAGTLGGNIANGSPIGDSMPALMALDSAVVLRSGSATRQVALSEFYVDYQQSVMEKDEFLERVRIPLRDQECLFDSYKVSKRFDQDISALCGAFYLRLDGSKIADVRLAYGGMAAIPKRASAAEAALRGNSWNEQSLRNAMQALDRDYSPISDMRASAAYRQQVSRNLLYRFWLESSGRTQRVYDYGR
jgi:xanthine dehydrogenase small subunit